MPDTSRTLYLGYCCLYHVPLALTEAVGYFEGNPPTRPQLLQQGVLKLSLSLLASHCIASSKLNIELKQELYEFYVAMCLNLRIACGCRSTSWFLLYFPFLPADYSISRPPPGCLPRSSPGLSGGVR